MNIKSLMIGSAALATVATGAQAADAIVVAQPEPVEYVRVCDVYGAGFFYIPGTETCLAIGGYFRYQINVNALPAATQGITKLARFAPRFDVRSDTEIGTIRGFAELEINHASGAAATSINAAHAFIQVVRPGGRHVWLFGRTHSPFSRFLGYGVFGINDQNVGFMNTQEISYTFQGSNGFKFILALVDDENGNPAAVGVNTLGRFAPDVEIGFRFDRSWGHIGIVGRVDVGDGNFRGGVATNNRGSGVKASFLVNWPNTKFSTKLQAGINNIGVPGQALAPFVNLGLQNAFTPKFTAYANVQVVTPPANLNFNAALGFVIQPTGTNALQIQPEIFANNISAANRTVGAIIRINRNFGGGAFPGGYGN